MTNTQFERMMAEIKAMRAVLEAAVSAPAPAPQEPVEAPAPRGRKGRGK